MGYEKKSRAEKIREKKEAISNWKDSRFDPWYKHTFKPAVKRAKKEVKRNVRSAVKSYRKHKDEKLKRKYNPSDNYNINIKNIENIENFAVGGKKQNQFVDIPQDNQLRLPNISPPQRITSKEPQIPPQRNRLTYEPKKPNLELEKLANWYDEIQSLYNSGYHTEVVSQGNKLIQYFLSRLAKYLNIKHNSVDDFLYKVNERGYRFQFSEEFNDYKRYLMIGTRRIGESSYWIYGIISKIIKRLYEIAGSTH